MKNWYATPAVLCVLLALGCRTNPRIAELQRDNRLKEDEIYRLRWQVDEIVEELERCRQVQPVGARSAPLPPPGQPILPHLGAPAAPGGLAPSDLPVQGGESISPEEFLRSRNVEPAPDRAPASEGPRLPFLEPPEGVPPAPAWPRPADAEPSDEAPPWSPAPPGRPEPPTDRGNAPSGVAPAGAAADVLPAKESRRAARLRLDPETTGGHSLDDRAGDEGLRVVLELLDEDDRPLRAPADVSIVLLDPDPTLAGDAARVARWDFSAEEVAAAIRAAGGSTRGIPLKVVWRDKLPQNEHLHLFVRYTTADGRPLEDQIEVRIRLEGSPAAAGWRTAPQQSTPPPPQEDRATTHPATPTAPAAPGRLVSRPPQPARPQPVAPAAPEAATARLPRPQWSPHRP